MASLRKRSIFENIEDLISPETSQASNAMDRMQCPLCSKSYLTFFGLRRHMQCHQDGRVDQTCVHCQKHYKSPGALKMHLKTHSLPCVCEKCGKSFSRKVISEHIQVRNRTLVRSVAEISLIVAISEHMNKHIFRKGNIDVSTVICHLLALKCSRNTKQFLPQDLMRIRADIVKKKK
ncbi:unnamed protein product [Cylicocyclus nassatus]|uniref:C2H2-type domain-containing protein n=1 Tax=Cylicocyclus nassatus TaxID=53992 RepID=A0AA36H560_CYLNA|nr:unnamed protein product [Cylicocyclus nassatus]